MGFSGVGSVRQGKVFDLVLGHDDQGKAEGELKAMCEKLLANMVIEDFVGGDYACGLVADAYVTKRRIASWTAGPLKRRSSSSMLRLPNSR